MLASILIATFNRDSLLELNLISLIEQNLNKKEIEIIVINDGLDTIETKNLVQKYSKELNIKYIFSGKRNKPDKLIWRNPGFAYNYGAQFSSGKYLFICGAEIYHENKTISIMINDIEEDINSMVIPQGLDDRDGEYTRLLINKNKNLKNSNIKLFDLNTKLPFLMCIPRDSFFKINGYDEDMIGIGYDDDDIVNRLNKIGLKYKQSSAKITHLFHKRTPDNYVIKTNQNPKILHDKLVFLNNQIYESRKNDSPVRNTDKEWGKNNIWYLKNIPKKIHFYWGDPNEYMSYLRYLSIYSAVENNPDFKIYLHLPSHISENKVSWSTQEQSTDITSPYNWFEEVKKLNINIIKHDFNNCGFSNEKHEVQKSDFIRWIILFEFGGFWSDMDIFYSRSLYELSCNVPENYLADTGIHIYPDCNLHAIGFLFSSLENSLFKECHKIASKKFNDIKNNNYQSFGSDILNNGFQTIKEINKKYPYLSIINIDKNTVYRVSPTDTEISSLYSGGNFEYLNNEIGIHWFGGHPLSRDFEKKFEEFNQEEFNNKLSNYIIKYRKKNTAKNKIVAGLMLKNENRFIFNKNFEEKPKFSMLEQCLNRVSEIADYIIIVDNDSTDGSRDIYEKYEKIIHVKYNKNLNFSDFRDRDYIINEAKKTDAKWMIMVDGDEVFEDNSVSWIKNFAQDNKNLKENTRVWFKYINLWRSRTKYREDKWNSSKFARMFSLNNLKINGEELHSYDITFSTPEIADIISPYKIIHYGWADWEHRIEKSFRYAITSMGLSQDSKIKNTDLYESNIYYVKEDLDEENIILKNVDTSWLKEFKK